MLSLIASVPGFADWQAAEVKPVRNLHDREARTNAVLWEVQAGSQMIGYLVTSPDGQHLYEFSTRPVPELPPHLQAQAAANGYLYGGPALQLAYVNGEQGAELVNLLTGEMLPDGELLDRVPDTVPVAQKTAGSPRVLPLPTTAHAQDDAFYATGLYGKAQLGDADTGVQPLQEFAKQADYRQPTMIVYDAIPDKLYITLSLSKAIHLGADTTFLAVHDPFALNAEQSQPIYIDSRFPVTAVPVRL
ncbi:hypothetical protein C7459_12061 [Tumebacillus permanentifrigoris]|uniref:Uncharacterized protein n=1 Tax=Tumebacillus permanentifrigoris TaxID=378543 RepID=A0A316D3Q0_9BACL|nr:hypothetical protein C7459_12061 [Tumebacillus permanentifrigoris]